MFENKLTTTLGNFSKYELNQFRKYILSPFFNENEDLLVLFDTLLPFFKKKTDVALDKEAIWVKIFSQKKYNDTKFRRLNSDLLKLAEGFIAYNLYNQSPIVPQLFLLKAIEERGFQNLENTNIKQAKNLQERHPYRNADYYYNEYQLQVELGTMNTKQFQRNEQVNIDKIVDNLDYFYLSEKLKYYCELTNYKRVFKVDYEPLFIDDILNHLGNVSYDHVPVIAIYYRILLTLEKEEEEHYYKLCELLEQHAEKFPIEEARMMYGFAQNYCIKKINVGKPDYLKELFKLYQTVLRKKIIFVNGELSPWDYKNIVTVGTRIGEFDWTQDFISEYKAFLPKDFRENAYTFNLSKLYFIQKKYDMVIQLLLTVEYQDVFYLLDSKTMLLKTYYELQEDDALYNLLDSFKVLLSRKKVVAPQYRTNYMNLLKHTRKLVEIRNGQKEKLPALKEAIVKDSNVADLGWLKEKIALLE